MKFTDTDFPYIVYDPEQTPFEWGRAHGEEFKEAIGELFEIRKELMLAKNPAIVGELDRLATEQFESTKSFSPDLHQELLGLCEGSGLSSTEIVILNNYTDFRDIELPNEGCSSLHVQREERSLSGQTWDMHGSAKNYVCLIHIPETWGYPEHLVFSLVGCLGMMGVNTHKALIGVNNINTKNARAGILWPALVRRCLYEKDLHSMKEVLLNAPVTSGHNYILSDPFGGEHWEVTPEEKDCIGALKKGDKSEVIHTNHCLGKKVKLLEDELSVNSTTLERLEILKKKTPQVQNLTDLQRLLSDHENYPKSICSHFESGAQDPSMTCGGGVGELSGNKVIFWRGCREYDDNYVQHNFEIRDQKIVRV